MKRIARFRLNGISLKAQLIVSFLAVTLLVLSVSSYYSYQKTMDVHEKVDQETTLTQFRLFETNTMALLSEVDKMSNSLYLEDNVQTFFKSGPLSDIDFVHLDQDISGRIVHYLSNYTYLDSIYIYLDNGLVIGGTMTRNQGSPLLGKDYPFYSTKLYKEAKDAYPRVLWRGGLTTLDFMRRTILTSSDPSNAHLISYFHAVSWLGGSQMKGVMVFNVNERYFHSSYSGLLSSPKGAVSIVDGSGMVISSTQEDSIANPYMFNKQIDADSAYGTFTANRNNTPEQVIYYRMSQTGWVLIHEVPIELYKKDIVSIQRFSVWIFVLSLLMIVLFTTLWMNRIMKSFHQLISGMKKVGRGNIGLTLPKASNAEIGLLIDHFNSMSTGILELMNQNEEAEKAKRKLEIEALQSQINPHFLYNTLNTVKWMAALTNSTNIMHCMTSLGNMLRPIFNDPSLLWSIREEIEFVQNYVNIMNYRYGEEFKFEFDIPEPFMDCQTLRFVIQPLIENSLNHGEIHKGTIRVSVFEKDGDLHLVVHDTCGGMPQSKVDEINGRIRSVLEDDRPHKGIGLYNVNKRIQLHFGVRYGIELTSREGIDTSVFLLIPVIRNDASVQKS